MFCAVRCVIIICFSLLFSSDFMVFNTFYVCFLVLYVFFSVSCILCFCTVLCIVSPFYTADCFLFLYKFTDGCHHVDTRLQKIDIVSYLCICFQTPRMDIVNRCRKDKASTKSEFSQNSKGCGIPHKIVDDLEERLLKLLKQ